ncbi:putative acetyltransferase [Caulobacter ginsengisoli]|uniref:Acetyltransferase n=1 Tax=Caulobacter ginsengisoli TaxID=400775 RepID=A0ABU0IYG4_9CAUL|nr:N-acetyltransferase [Caulobacter ginsengisoli]MDQ0466094.1 putative acetyltransferase [Caulobacter ginsengisoli]
MIRPAVPSDWPAIHAVETAAFGRPDEADLVEALRADGDALVELVAEEGGAVVGHILFSPLATDTGAAFAALAPVAIRPDRQKDGLGGGLILAGLQACRDLDIEAVILLGHPSYYPRFGFSAEAALKVAAPFKGRSFMGLALTEGALEKPVAITYAKAFGL